MRMSKKCLTTRMSVSGEHNRYLLSKLDILCADPIDPAFFSPQRPTSTLLESPIAVAPTPAAHAAPVPEPAVTGEEAGEEDPEQARRHTIAERMARLGGIRFGAPPPPPVRRPRPPTPTEGHDTEETISPQQGPPEQEPEIEEPEEEEDEFARKQRIAARIAGMGGMRFGMMPGAVPPQAQQSRVIHDAPEETERVRSPPPPRSVPVPPPPPSEPLDSDGEHVELEGSEPEELSYPEVQDVPAPPIPSREGRRASAAESQRPPVPQGMRPPVPQVPVTPISSRPARASSGAEASANQGFSYPPQPPPTRAVPSSHDTQGEYVIVGDEVDEQPPPPPPRTVSLKRTNPPPRTAPPPLPPLETSDTQKQIPSIPSVDFGGETEI